MREDTSGLMFTQYDDGSIRIEAVDYNVDRFGGGDFESWYDLDKQNAELLYAELCKMHSGTFEEILVKEFTETFNMSRFEKFCHDHGIEYRHMTWTS